MNHRVRVLGWSAIACVAVVGAVQGQKPKSTPEQRVVALSRGLYRLTSLGDSAVLTARIFGENFKPLPGVPIAWRSDDEGIATASTNGVVSAIKNGTTRIWARAGTDSVFAVVTVEQRPVKLAWNVGSPIVFDAIGASASLRAEQRDARGNPVRGDFPVSAGCKLTNSGGSGAVQLVAGPKLLARGPGAATLACSRGSVKDELKIVVQQAVFAAKVSPADTINLAAAGDTVRLSIAAFDRLGKPITDARAAWSSVTPEFVEVESGSGLLLGKAMGAGKLAAKFGEFVDTITVNVLAPLPEGKVLPMLAQARPAAPPPQVPAQVSAPVTSAANAQVAAAPPSAAPSAPAGVPSPLGGRVPTGTTFRSSAPVAAFGSAPTAASAASDSAAILQILSGQVVNARQQGRTWVITPIALQMEHRGLGIVNPNPTPPVLPLAKRYTQLRTSTGLLVGVAMQVQLYRSFYLDGHYATGKIKASAGTVTVDTTGTKSTGPIDNLNDGDMRDARVDVGFRALPGLAFRVGYATKGVDRPDSLRMAIVRAGFDGDFSLAGDKMHGIVGFTYMPSVSTNFGRAPSSAMGGNVGLEYRAGWFTAGVEYFVESFEYATDVSFNDGFALQDRFSALRVRVGLHFGK